jgi:ubiquinone/menaquinone biosynthesis C-methylase UbiE
VASHLIDQFVLRTIDGAADLLVEELRAMSSVHSIRQTSAETVECAVDGPLDQLVACSLYLTVAVRDPEKSGEFGVLSTLDQPISFRVGEPDPVRRHALIAAMEQRFGWINAPGNWNVNLTAGMAEIGPLSWMRRFGRSERLPWSTNPVVAEVLVRLAKIRSGHRVIDPFCGTGTILRAVRRRAPGAHVIGTDHDPRALEIATANGCRELAQADAAALPYKDSSVDRVVANLPFGKQVGSHEFNRTLYPALLRELDRVLTAAGRAVLLTEDKRLLHNAIQAHRALKIVRQRLLKYNGATPTAYVLTRTEAWTKRANRR